MNTNENGGSIFANKIVDDSGMTSYVPTEINSFDFGGFTYNVNVNPDNGSLTLSSEDAEGNTLTGDNLPSATLSFNKEDGSFSGVSGNDGELLNSLNFSIHQEPTAYEEINIDFSSLTMYSTSGNSSLEAAKGSIDGMGAGRQVGNLSGIGIDTAGRIYGRYDNGDSRLLGQIAVAKFSNPSGLEAVGNNMFIQTQNSGEFDGIGQDITSDGGAFTTGALEMSNVDLASEFTDMITTQRGFQANSRIITVSDTLLEELINLKR